MQTCKDYTIIHNGVRLEFQILDELQCHLRFLIVKPNHRNLGFGTSVFKEFIHYIFNIRKLQFITLVALPQSKRTSVLRLFEFYRRFGFDNPDESHFFTLENPNVNKGREEAVSH